MAEPKRVVEISQQWMVWLGKESGVRFTGEQDALSALRESGLDCDERNCFGRFDHASPIALLTWNRPLEGGENYHKMVVSPVFFVLWGGLPRKILSYQSPSRLRGVRKDWGQLKEYGMLPWWVDQYDRALDDPDTVRYSGRKPIHDVLRGRFGPAA